MQRQNILITLSENVVTVSNKLKQASKNMTPNTYSHMINSKKVLVAHKQVLFRIEIKFYKTILQLSIRVS